MPKPTKFYGFQFHDGTKWHEPTYPGIRNKEEARFKAKLMAGELTVRLITYTPTQVTEYGEVKK